MALNSDLLGGPTDSGLSNTVVGIFATTHDAREAIKHLHKGNFKQTWLGVTKPPDRQTGEPLVEDPNSLSRFITADRLPLHKALLQHGVSETQAQEIEENIAPGCAVLTVYGEDNPARVAELLRENKGHVIEPGTDLPEAVIIAGTNPRTGVDSDERKQNERALDRDATTGRIEPNDTYGTAGNTTPYSSGSSALLEREDREAAYDRKDAMRDDTPGDADFAYEESEFVESRPRMRF